MYKGTWLPAKCLKLLMQIQTNLQQHQKLSATIHERNSAHVRYSATASDPCPTSTIGLPPKCSRKIEVPLALQSLIPRPLEQKTTPYTPVQTSHLLTARTEVQYAFWISRSDSVFEHQNYRPTTWPRTMPQIAGRMTRTSRTRHSSR